MGTVGRPTLLARFVYSPLNYWASLVGDALMAVGFLLFGFWLWMRSGFVGSPTAIDLLVPLLALASGWLFWSLAEYVLHRYVLHGPRSLARDGHAQHHSDEHALLASPLFIIPGIELLIWWLLSLAIGAMPSALFVAGAASGYASFSLLQHVFHHLERRHEEGKPRRWGLLESLKRNHDVHHGSARYNFGTTTSLWDRVFGTYRAPRSSKA